jgi:hypothetical protein
LAGAGAFFAAAGAADFLGAAFSSSDELSSSSDELFCGFGLAAGADF